MKSNSSIAVLLGAIAVAVLSFFSVTDYWRFATAYNEKNPDAYRIGFQEPRFRAVAAQVPPNAVLGYISNLGFNDLKGSTAFFGAQYGLTPRILVPWDSEYATGLVLGNFSTQIDPESYAASHGMVLVEDFGAGVILFRKEQGK